MEKRHIDLTNGHSFYGEQARLITVIFGLGGASHHHYASLIEHDGYLESIAGNDHERVHFFCFDDALVLQHHRTGKQPEEITEMRGGVPQASAGHPSLTVLEKRLRQLINQPDALLSLREHEGRVHHKPPEKGFDASW